MVDAFRAGDTPLSSPGLAPRTTVTLVEAYEEALRIAARPEQAAVVAEMHAIFEGRTGHFGPDDAWFEARSRAFWDDALTRQGFAERVAPEMPAGARAWRFGTAHRGLFHVVRDSRTGEAPLLLADVWSGAELVVDEVDPASRDAIHAAVAPFDGRVVARETPLSLGLLPGAVFHPAEALLAMGLVLDAGKKGKLATHDFLDALLRMERALRTLSRVKPAYAYRPEALHARG